MTLHSTLTNGSATVINGRGINHRKLDLHQCAELAVDAVTRLRPFVPSLGQVCTMFRVSPPVLRQHLKARRTASTNTEQDEVLTLGEAWDRLIASM